MAIRLLPFRQYNEHDVINLFRLNDTDLTACETAASPTVNGKWDNGVIVKIEDADFTKEPVEYGDFAYQGKTDYPHIGRNQYPMATPTYECAGAGGAALGVTLRQTLTHDENGEKMLYYPQKALELNAVLPGQAVPILTRGLITVSAAGLGTLTSPAPGMKLYSDADGKFTSVGSSNPVGQLIGLGERDQVGTNPDYFAKDGTSSQGQYAVIKLEL